MLFNFGKSKCIHIGHGNVSREYFVGNTILGTSVKEKDLGVTVSADMTVSEQCGLAAANGNQILGLIRRNITNMEKTLSIPVYKALVRPHLEYYITFRHGGHVIRKTLINYKEFNGGQLILFQNLNIYAMKDACWNVD